MSASTSSTLTKRKNKKNSNTDTNQKNENVNNVSKSKADVEELRLKHRKLMFANVRKRTVPLSTVIIYGFLLLAAIFIFVASIMILSAPLEVKDKLTKFAFSSMASYQRYITNSSKLDRPSVESKLLEKLFEDGILEKGFEAMTSDMPQLQPWNSSFPYDISIIRNSLLARTNDLFPFPYFFSPCQPYPTSIEYDCNLDIMEQHSDDDKNNDVTTDASDSNNSNINNDNDNNCYLNGTWIKCMPSMLQVSQFKRSRYLLYFHGGGFIEGSIETYSGMFAYVLKRWQRVYNKLDTHLETLMFDYRLSPEHPLPAAIEDCINAYLHLISDREIDPNHIIFVGDSAGGNLVLNVMISIIKYNNHVIAQAKKNNPSLSTNDSNNNNNNKIEGLIPLPGGGVALSPWLDLTTSFPSYEYNNGKCSILSADFVRMAAEHCAPSLQTKLRYSPLYSIFGENYLANLTDIQNNVNDNDNDNNNNNNNNAIIDTTDYDLLNQLPPILLQIGDYDVLYDEVKHFALKAEEAFILLNKNNNEENIVYVNPFHFQEYKNQMHDFFVFVDYLPEAKEAVDKALVFMQKFVFNIKPAKAKIPKFQQQSPIAEDTKPSYKSKFKSFR